MRFDVLYALRQLRKAPGFAAVAILTLALCIGANSAIFSVVNTVLLKPYPWKDSERLVYLYNSYTLMGIENAGSSIPDYLDRRERARGIEESALYNHVSYNLASEGAPERLMALRATPSLFSTLQAGAQLGRVLREEDAQEGAEPVMVLSHAFWQARFGGDPRVVGSTVRLDGNPVTVVGVMPEAFYFPTARVQAWVPFVFTAAQRSDEERGTEFSTSIGRLRAGATREQVQRELDLIQVQNAERIVEQREFWKNAGFGGRVVGFLDHNVANVRGMLWLIQGGVAAALLIGCANIAALLLARAASRSGEFAMRAALGASRARLIRMLLTESVVLFVAGGALGLLVALGSVKGLTSVVFSTLPRASEVGLDSTVFAFTLLCALVTGLLFGLVPGLAATRGNPAAIIKEAGARATGGRHTQRTRGALVVAEIALAVMLLSTAGLLVKSFAQLQRQNPGFSPSGVITARMDLPRGRYDSPEKLAAFHRTLMAQLAALPGGAVAGVTSTLPFTGNNWNSSYNSPDIVLPAGAPLPHAQLRSVDEGYLRALGLTLLRGRWISAADTAASQKVCVVDRLLVDRYWPGEDGLGKRIEHNDQLYQVVGVVAPVKVRTLDETLSKETLYLPFAQMPSYYLNVVVRTQGDPMALVSHLREAVRAADPEQATFDIKTMSARMDDAAQPRRAPMLLLSLFSAIALLLAALGVYGVLAYTVVQRRAEFGIRLALGATARNIASLVLGDSLRLIVAGAALGVLGYLALSRLVATLLFGVSAADPLMLALAPAILAVVAVAASLLPARRAVRVDPIVALRSE